jgi:hypothetical protein
MGNQHAIGQWWNPVTSSAGRLKDQASPPALEVMSEEQLDQLAPGLTEAERERGMLTLSHPINLPPGLLTQVALQIKALEPRKGLTLEELFPRAYQLLCEEQKFLFGSEERELAFIETHGRRWRAGEGFDYSKVPPIAELKFDPANLEASCNLLRSWFEGIKLARWNKTLAEHVMECHKAIHRAQEARKELLRAQGEPGCLRSRKTELQGICA